MSAMATPAQVRQALRNGTIGWTLAGLALESGQERRFPPPSLEGRARAQAAARSVAERAGRVDRATLAAWRADEKRTLYLFDVRTPEEYENGHLPGFRNAAGGQLAQATDEYIGVRRSARGIARHEGSAAWLPGPTAGVPALAANPPHRAPEPRPVTSTKGVFPTSVRAFGFTEGMAITFACGLLMNGMPAARPKNLF